MSSHPCVYTCTCDRSCHSVQSVEQAQHNSNIRICMHSLNNTRATNETFFIFIVLWSALLENLCKNQILQMTKSYDISVYYCKTLYFCCVLISRFSYVENSLHFNLVYFPGTDIFYEDR